MEAAMKEILDAILDPGSQPADFAALPLPRSYRAVTLHRDEEAEQLKLNEIGRVTLRVTQPLFCDPYSRNRLTGGLILIDEGTSATVGAGMITDN